MTTLYFCPPSQTDPPAMADIYAAQLERLARRVGMWHDRYEATGDEKYLRLAVEADRRYLRARRAFR